MQLICLGTGCAVPNPFRGSAGYVVKTQHTNLLMDCGGGTLQRLAKAGLKPADLTAIFISHTHLDHIGELPALLFALRLSEPRRSKPLTIHGGPGLAAMIDALNTVYGDWIAPHGHDLKIVEHTVETFEIGELLCRTRPVQHHSTSVGLRVQSPQGCTLAYSGDTVLCDDLVELCGNVDLALVECSHLDDVETAHHMTPKDIAELARRAEPASLVLTHLYPRTAEANLLEIMAQHGCALRIGVAFDGMGVAIDPPDL